MGDELASLKKRIADLENEFQPFKKKLEAGYFKGDAAAATGTATGVSGEASLVTSSVKLAAFDFDLRQHLKDKKLQRDGKDPDSLHDHIVEVDRRADRRLRDMNRDLNQKIRRKADRSAVGGVNTRQNNEIRDLQRSASRAHDELQRLYGAMAHLNSQF
ncbi:hypothetical protein [Streptomyces aureoverticillatus]|uniref:hypothetical protein n=1 Tax=Streptomyces aureoverticillatus TaxID=66871 RepID=UPI0013DB4B65|nr:hypothetical protein [Streptomyces aureoverticillatus]QIB44259.1 hypothetical protein G3H79_15350 [Streptomyces aureoverticillatus]